MTSEPSSASAVEGAGERLASPVRPIQPAVEPPRAKPEPRPAPEPTGGARLFGAAVLLASVVGMLAAAAVGLGESWTADPLGDETEWALSATPANPVSWRRRAFDFAYDRGAPEAALPALEQAARLDPLDGEGAIALAAHLEADGDLPRAERVLRSTAEAVHGFEPRWALANFYLRQGDEESFWRWIREAVRVDPQRVPTALGLCWRAFDDPALIQQQGLPDDLRITREYFHYLTETKRVEALALLWDRFAPLLEEQDLEAGAQYLDILLEAGRLDRALAIWNDLCERELLPYEPLSPSGGPFLTNPLFQHPVSSMGFDWRLERMRGVLRFQRRLAGMNHGVEFRISGNQEEHAVLLSQILALEGERNFTLEFQYASQRLPRNTGIRWVLRDYLTNRELARDDFLIAAEDFWDEGRFTFRAPEGLTSLRLDFEYRLTEGNTRQLGRLVLRRLRLRPATAEEEPEDSGPEWSTAGSRAEL